MTQEHDELQKRLAGATPQAARAAQAERDKKYIIDNYYPKGRGPKHFRGMITDITGPHTRSGTFDGEYTEWDVMTVHIDPNTMEIYEDNKENPGQAQFDVRLPASGEDASPDSELVLTVESAMNLERSPIRSYYDFKGKVVEFKADVKVLPLRRNQRYATRVFFYDCTFVGGEAGLSQAGAAPTEADPADLQKLASFFIGKQPGAVKRVDILRFIGQNKPWIAEAAISSLVGTDQYLDRAMADGLLAVSSEDGRYFDPTGELTAATT